MEARGSKGLFVGVIASNVNAAKFYEATGFKRLPRVLDNSISGEIGRTGRDADGGEEVYFVVNL